MSFDSGGFTNLTTRRKAAVANEHLEILNKAILQTKVRRIHYVSTLAKSQLVKEEAELATECLIKAQELLKVLQEMVAEKDSCS